MNWVIAGMVAWMLLLVGICVHDSITRKKRFAQKRVSNAAAKGMTLVEYEAWLESVSPH